MKASLLARTAPALLIAGVLTGGLAAPSLAQTTSPGTAAPAEHNAQTTAPATAAPGTASPGTASPGTAAPGTAAPAAPHAQTAERGVTDQTLVERRITELHERLQITPKQQKQWDAFAKVMRENARDMDDAYRSRSQDLSHMNALQNLESYEKLERTRVRDVHRLVTPFRHLYGVLSPQQKQSADQLFQEKAQQHESHREQNVQGSTH